MRNLELDLESIRSKLTAWFEAQLPEAAAVSLSPLEMPGMGASNETFLCDLRWRDGGEPKLLKLAVRWAPMAYPLYPKYDMREQFLLLRALEGSAVPAPRVHWLEQDTSVIGSPFFVMERIEGWTPADNPSYHQAGPLFEGPESFREAIWWQGVDTLAAIHTLPWQQRGQGVLGVPGGGTDPIDRHIAYYETMLGMAEAEPRPLLLEVLCWLKTNAVVPDNVSLCWGDARLGNLLFRDDALAGVLDWEMALLGDPESDLLWYLLMDWALCEGHFVAPSQRLAGLPETQATLDRYRSATGREVKNFFYHDVFATWRFAVIMHRADVILKATGYHQEGVDVHSNLENRLRSLLAL